MMRCFEVLLSTLSLRPYITVSQETKKYTTLLFHTHVVGPDRMHRHVTQRISLRCIVTCLLLSYEWAL